MDWSDAGVTADTGDTAATVNCFTQIEIFGLCEISFSIFLAFFCVFVY